jgi:predicted DNA-binding protein YlxM (UPF0122 family)
MLDKVLKMGLLFDFYGALLTAKQRQCFEMHYLNDLSLSEIAEQFTVSRQAVHDILRRAEQTLGEYECKLGLVSRYQRERQAIKQIDEIIQHMPSQLKELPEIGMISNIIGTLTEASLKEV